VFYLMYPATPTFATGYYSIDNLNTWTNPYTFNDIKKVQAVGCFTLDQKQRLLNNVVSTTPSEWYHASVNIYEWEDSQCCANYCLFKNNDWKFSMVSFNTTSNSWSCSCDNFLLNLNYNKVVSNVRACGQKACPNTFGDGCAITNTNSGVLNYLAKIPS